MKNEVKINLREIVREFYSFLIRDPDRRMLKRIFYRKKKEFEKGSGVYSVCFPSLKEVIRGELNENEYSSDECADYAGELLFKTWLEYRDWAYKHAIKYALRAYKLIQNI